MDKFRHEYRFDCAWDAIGEVVQAMTGRPDGSTTAHIEHDTININVVGPAGGNPEITWNTGDDFAAKECLRCLLDPEGRMSEDELWTRVLLGPSTHCPHCDGGPDDPNVDLTIIPESDTCTDDRFCMKCERSWETI